MQSRNEVNIIRLNNGPFHFPVLFSLLQWSSWAWVIIRRIVLMPRKRHIDLLLSSSSRKHWVHWVLPFVSWLQLTGLERPRNSPDLVYVCVCVCVTNLWTDALTINHCTLRLSELCFQERHLAQETNELDFDWLFSFLSTRIRKLCHSRFCMCGTEKTKVTLFYFTIKNTIIKVKNVSQWPNCSKLLS